MDLPYNNCEPFFFDITLQDSLTMYVNMSTMIAIFAYMWWGDFIGQHFTDQGINIFNALYDVPWYQLLPNDRKYLHMMILSTTKEQVDFHKILALSWGHYMTVINATYSYFTFLQSSL